MNYILTSLALITLLEKNSSEVLFNRTFLSSRIWIRDRGTTYFRSKRKNKSLSVATSKEF